jgi:hypothetical protein
MVSQARAQSPRRRVGPCGVSRGLRRESDAVDTNAATIRHQGLLRPGVQIAPVAPPRAPELLVGPPKSGCSAPCCFGRQPSSVSVGDSCGPSARGSPQGPALVAPADAGATSLTVSPLVRGAIAAMLIAIAPLRAACARADTDERHEGWLPGAGLTDDPTRRHLPRAHPNVRVMLNRWLVSRPGIRPTPHRSTWPPPRDPARMRSPRPNAVRGDQPERLDAAGSGGKDRGDTGEKSASRRRRRCCASGAWPTAAETQPRERRTPWAGILS